MTNINQAQDAQTGFTAETLANRLRDLELTRNSDSMESNCSTTCHPAASTRPSTPTATATMRPPAVPNPNDTLGGLTTHVAIQEPPSVSQPSTAQRFIAAMPEQQATERSDETKKTNRSGRSLLKESIKGIGAGFKSATVVISDIYKDLKHLSIKADEEKKRKRALRKQAKRRARSNSGAQQGGMGGHGLLNGSHHPQGQ